jgi:hypothetical protein
MHGLRQLNVAMGAARERRLILWLAGGAALAVLAYVAWSSRSSPVAHRPSLPAPEGSQASDVGTDPSWGGAGAPSNPTHSDPDIGPESGREEAPNSSKRVVYKSSLDYLSFFWGAKWPELRAELERFHPETLARFEALELTEDLVPPALASIHEEIVRRLLADFDDPATQAGTLFFARADPWPEELTAQFLVERLGAGGPLITDEQVQDLQALSESYTQPLSELRDAYFAQARIDVEIEARAKGYIAWPLVYVGDGVSAATGGEPPLTRDQLPKGSIKLVISFNGLWIVALYLDLDSRPYLADLWRQLEEQGRERERQARRILSGR